MKIIAHSTVPAKMPYLHIGYNAASNPVDYPGSPASAFGTGLVFVLVGLALTVGSAWTGKKIIPWSWRKLWRNPLAWTSVGASLIILAIVW